MFARGDLVDYLGAPHRVAAVEVRVGHSPFYWLTPAPQQRRPRAAASEPRAKRVGATPKRAGAPSARRATVSTASIFWWARPDPARPPPAAPA